MTFASEFKKLNPRQREAVETIEGPVMVVAGPGTGKTQVLTLRIANILLRTDTPEESILALTFTESAVASMRQRLFDLIGPQAYKVSIKTIHGFCNEIIQNYPEEFKEISGAVNITEVDQIRLVRELLDGSPSPSLASRGTRSGSSTYERLRSFGDPYRNVRDILSAISDLKRENVSPEDFVKIVKWEEKDFKNIDDLYHERGAHKGQMKGKYQQEEKQIEKHKELAALYGAYQKELRRRREYDYDDMIMEAARALETQHALRYTLQEKYLYLLVDEHQDTNQSQNKVIELLASFHERPNLFVVGDEKQAIYRFQGASVENFNYFKKRFHGAKIIALTDNYRSTQTILDAALNISHPISAAVRSHSSGKGSRLARRSVYLRAKAGHKPKPIQLAAFSEPDVEHYFLATDIKKRIASGTKPREIAVLYRDNKDAAPVARMMEKLGVPFSIQSDDDVLEDVAIRKLLTIFEGVRNFGADYALIPLLYLDFFKIAPLDVVLLLDAARKQKSSVFVLIRDKKALEKIVPESAAAIFDLYQRLSLWKAMSKSNNPVEVFETIVRESGFLAEIVGSAPLTSASGGEKLAKLHALFDQLKALVESKHKTTLDDFLDHLDIIREHRVRLASSNVLSKVNGQRPMVNLMTAHKAKGLEFEYVYIIGAVHTHWGSRRNRDFIKLPEAIYSQSVIAIRQPAEKQSRKLDPCLPAGRATANYRLAMTNEDDGDERNIFYVALTRAKKEVVITYSQKNTEGKDQLISEFVADIRPELVEKIDTKKIEKEFSQNRAIEFASPVRIRQLAEKEKEYNAFLKKRFLERGLTASALNNYLECPQKFYFVNLIGIPEAQNKFSQFGNATHGALKFVTQEVNAGKKVSKEQVLKYFERTLSREPISQRDFDDMIVKGRKSLGAYFDRYYKSWPKNSLAEYSVRGVKVGDIEIRGRIDRIDFVGAPHPAFMHESRARGDREVTVIDYKTGRVKTRNEIAGLTKDSDGNFRRQLAFYKLLLEKVSAKGGSASGGKGQWSNVKGCVIDFVEPDPRGKFHQELFAPSDKEVKELESQIKQVAGEIMELKFKGCGEKDCKYCLMII